MAVYLIGTCDTKGHELAFVRDALRSAGVATLLVDAGVMEPPSVTPDIPREALFAAGGAVIEELRQRGDRGVAITAAAAGARALIRERHARGEVDGVMGVGGSAGATIATAAMRELPLGVPKLMVTTLASGQTRPFVGARDITMMHSVTDISGINRISRLILSRAAAAMAGMARTPPPPSTNEDRPLLAASMFGVTTPCVERCRALAEAAGYEVLVFHAVGTGGEAMESLIGDRLIRGVLDVTTTELADDLVGGVLSAGPDRLTAAGRVGAPQVISVGALDMVNFGPRATVPAKFEQRRFHVHNENVTLMRTTPEENRELGERIAAKANAAAGPTVIVLPLRGVSAIDAPGKPFWWPEADAALFDAIRAHAKAPTKVVEVDAAINDPPFADALWARMQWALATAPVPSA